MTLSLKIEFLLEQNNLLIAATVSKHNLRMTLCSLVGKMLKVAWFCIILQLTPIELQNS